MVKQPLRRITPAIVIVLKQKAKMRPLQVMAQMQVVKMRQQLVTMQLHQVETAQH